MKRVYQNLLVPVLDAGPQKDRPYQSDFIGPVLMRSRVKRGNRIVLTPPYGVVVWYGIRLNRYSPINAITACIVCVIWMILCRYVSRLSSFSSLM